jgi:SAM-dependent methyltransferase
MDNPWLNIPAADYEAHMGSPDVGQLAFLGRTFKEAVERYDCSAVALLGCATGNGLEYVNREMTKKVTVVDINPEYLEMVRKRFNKSLPGLAIMEADLENCELEKRAYSLVFAGLIFEYLNPQKVISRVACWLRQKGVMVAVLQLPAKDGQKVTETPYAILKKLESVMHLLSPQDFNSMATDSGLLAADRRIITLGSGKSFYIGTYIKN